MKLNLKRVFAILVLLLLFFLFFLPFVGCSSTKKNKQKESFNLEKKTESDSSGTKAVITDEKKSEEAAKKVSEEKKVFDVKVKDGKEVSIKEFDQNGNLKGETVIKGDGEVKTSSEKKDTEETSKKDTSKTTESNENSNVNKKEDLDSSGTKLDLQLEKKGFSFGDYIFCFVLIIAIIILAYLNNRFKWIPIFKNKENEE